MGLIFPDADARVVNLKEVRPEDALGQNPGRRSWTRAGRGRVRKELQRAPDRYFKLFAYVRRTRLEESFSGRLPVKYSRMRMRGLLTLNK